MSDSYFPQVKDWELYFDAKDGADNRAEVARAFTEFWMNTASERLVVPGNCKLGGNVFGHQSFKDGDEIFTSSIRLIERVERYCFNGISSDLLCAVTASGSRYFFYSNDYNAFMALMMGDMLNIGTLNSRPYFYLKPELYASGLI